MYSPLGIFHLIAAIIALICGALVLLNIKGNNRHRLLGTIYLVAMTIVVVSALCMYRLTGSANILHVFAMLSLITIVMGMTQLAAKRFLKRAISPNWFDFHTQSMVWSYIGLLAALIAESATRIGMPYLIAQGYQSFGWFWGIVGFATFLVCFSGAFLLAHNKAAIERYRTKQ
ncbi:MAG: DUF2306 domain-containing protein [Gammaproteobacteria bacterium]|nr:DUF2306 domain-containing protein [Gammaproteobacteria bacterium]